MELSVQQVRPAIEGLTLYVQDATWMDDLCVFAAFPSASELLSAWRSIAGTVFDACLEKGMKPNLSGNKTETLLRVSGKGSKNLRKLLLSDSEPSLCTHPKHWPGAEVKVVAKYKHLSGIVHHKSGVPEARSRAAQACSAFQRHKRTIFGHSHVDVEDKTSLFTTLVLSSLFYACGTWCEVPYQALAVLQKAYLNMARVMLSKHFKEMYCIFVRIVFCPCSACPLSVSGCTFIDSLTWPHLSKLKCRSCGVWLMRKDTGWPQFVLPPYSGCGSSLMQVRGIPHELSVQLVKKLPGKAGQQCGGLVLKRLIDAGGVIPAWEDSDGDHVCGACQKVFASLQAWAVHAFKSHGLVRESRKLVAGEQCPICLRQFPSNIQLCAHVDASKTCKRELRAVVRLVLMRISWVCRGRALVPVCAFSSMLRPFQSSSLTVLQRGRLCKGFCCLLTLAVLLSSCPSIVLRCARSASLCRTCIVACVNGAGFWRTVEARIVPSCFQLCARKFATGCNRTLRLPGLFIQATVP